MQQKNSRSQIGGLHDVEEVWKLWAHCLCLDAALGFPATGMTINPQINTCGPRKTLKAAQTVIVVISEKQAQPNPSSTQLLYRTGNLLGLMRTPHIQKHKFFFYSAGQKFRTWIFCDPPPERGGLTSNMQNSTINCPPLPKFTYLLQGG